MGGGGEESGTLKFDPDLGFRLAIPFRRMTESFSGGWGPSPVGDITGVTQSGRHVRLLDPILVGTSVTLPGAAREEYSAAKGLVSRAPCDRDPSVSTVTLGFEGLRDWVGSCPIEVEWHDDMSAVYRYEYPPQEVLSRGDGWTISLTHVASHGRPTPKGLSLKNDCQLVVDLDSPVLLSELQERFVGPLGAFLSILMDYPTTVTKVSANKPPIDVYFAQYLVDPGKSPRHPAFMLMSKAALGDRLGDALCHWIALDGDSLEAMSLLVGMARRKVPVDLRFLVAAQALEAVSRIDSDQHELDEADFRSRVDRVLGAIEDKELRDWTKRKLAYANRRSAHQMLRAMLDQLDSIPITIAPARDRFLADHRASRNFYSHRDRRSEPGRLTGEALFVHTEGVLLLLKAAALCIILGVDSVEANRRLQECEGTSHWMRRVSDMYRGGS